MVLDRCIADYGEIIKRDCMVSLGKLEKMVFLKPLAAAAGEHYCNDEIRDEKGSLDQ